jgi:hypothetical protein
VANNTLPLRRSITIELTAAPEPTSWEIMAKVPEMDLATFFAIPREDAPTEELALEVAAAIVKVRLLQAHPGAQVEEIAPEGERPAAATQFRSDDGR